MKTQRTIAILALVILTGCATTAPRKQLAAPPAPSTNVLRSILTKIGDAVTNANAASQQVKTDASAIKNDASRVDAKASVLLDGMP